ncbi:MAG TPA: hypothetical protein VGK22_13540 [Candidatus Angelobacter sp.]
MGKLVIEKAKQLNFMQHGTDQMMAENKQREPEARYGYYRRCQEFRRNGEQCKAPAEKGAQICHAHAGQRAMALRRERERRAVLAEAVAVMRKKGYLQCEMADLFTSFNGIQVTLALMAQALINGRIDCKTAGRLVVHLQTMSKLLRMVDRKGRKKQILPQIHGELGQICANERKLGRTLPLIHTDNTDRANRVRADGTKAVKIVAIRWATRWNAVPYTDTGPSSWQKAA